MHGKLIVIEGTDGSGKSTQKRMLTDALKKSNIDFREVTFPRYNEESSCLVRKYLNGEFGNNPMDVSAKTASVFFAVDRYASYKDSWEKYYANGGIIICDRYTTSNAVHQTPKLSKNDWWSFTDWLFDFEYNIMGIPIPDLVLLLDMPPEKSFKLLNVRQGNGGDIHEKNHEYLKLCHDCALQISEKYGWNKISCADNNNVRSIDDIASEILKIVMEKIK